MMHAGIDVGGTFTDSVVFDGRTGEFRLDKRLTTPADPCRAVLEAGTALVDDGGSALGALEQVLHATTLVTNALIERKGAPTALITTEGYRDTLEIGRDVRFDLFDLNIDRPEPLVPRFRRLEVRERIREDGSILVPLDEASVAAVLETLRGDGVESIAVCLLHAYRNPLHERWIGDLLAQELPGVAVSLSSDVCPEIREYERNSTVVANAYVRPLAESYLRQLDAGLKSGGFGGRLSMMNSWGGIMAVETAAALPIWLMESGPAAGVTAAAKVATDWDWIACFVRDGGHDDQDLLHRRRPGKQDGDIRGRAHSAVSNAAADCFSEFRLSTWSKSVPAAARSPGVTPSASSSSDPKAPGPIRVRLVTGSGGVRPRSRTRTCARPYRIHTTSSAAKWFSTSRRRNKPSRSSPTLWPCRQKRLPAVSAMS